MLPRILAFAGSLRRESFNKKLAAIAVFDLDRPDSSLFMSSVAESIGVLAGEERTPTGLLVAAR